MVAESAKRYEEDIFNLPLHKDYNSRFWTVFDKKSENYMNFYVFLPIHHLQEAFESRKIK